MFAGGAARRNPPDEAAESVGYGAFIAQRPPENLFRYAPNPPYGGTPSQNLAPAYPVFRSPLS
jgi:hypothetical protein